MAVGITFKETMKGSFALNQTDAAAGAEFGELAGTALAMHAAVSIDDLDAFIAGPDHLGRLTGRN